MKLSIYQSLFVCIRLCFDSTILFLLWFSHIRYKILRLCFCVLQVCISFCKGILHSLVNLIPSVYMTNLCFIMVMYEYFFDGSVYVLVPIVKKLCDSGIFWNLVFCLPHEFIYQRKVVWYVINHLNSCSCPFLYDVNHELFWFCWPCNIGQISLFV